MAELRVLVIRHGARPYIHHDPELLPLGHEQAQALADALTALYPDVRAIYASPFIRCLQTSKPIARAYIGTHVRVEYGICELMAEGWLQDENPLPHLAFVQKDFPQRKDTPPIDRAYRSAPVPTFPDCIGIPTGDSGRAVCLERHRVVLRAIEKEFAGTGGTVIIVGHGATHDFLTEAACPAELPEEVKTPHCVANCSVTTLVRWGGSWYLGHGGPHHGKLQWFGQELIPEALRQHM